MAAAGATLALHDKLGREVGSLIVQLQDTTAQASTAAIDGAVNDIEQHPTGSVVDSLKQVMDKTRVVVDLVDKTAKVTRCSGVISGML